MICLFLAGTVPTPEVLAAAPSSIIDLTLSRSRVKRGESIEITVKAQGQVKAVLLTPTTGYKALELIPSANQPNSFRANVLLDQDAPDGIYVVHAWTGDFSRPDAVSKSTFLLGQLVVDFFIPAYLDRAKPNDDIENYLREFRSLGGNFLIAHNLIIPAKAFYPSRIARTDVAAGSAGDLVELTLSRANKYGLPVLLSISWDMTKQSPFKERMAEIKAIASELYDLYKHHPSLAGFYSYQEGSGTYYVPFVREFTQHIKSLNRNLLTACAPHIDDPLLAGYLSVVEELDIIIYQAGVMASYRPDKRKLYPFRRVKDFCGLGAGARRLQNKISINHVELFGYLENRLAPDTTATTYDNIYQQILSAATISGADGISFFTYQAHVYEPSKKLPQVARSRAAVFDGMKAFRMMNEKVVPDRNPLAVYFPYSDWVIERWHNYFLPALDAFRVLGVSVDLLPYAPPLEESVYPYYPFGMNRKVLERLLSEKTVLVLPNVSGFQQTDSDLIKAFIEQGGSLVAFGPQLPMGRSYDRRELFAIGEEPKRSDHSSVVVVDTIGDRVKAGTRISFVSQQPSLWTTKGARVIATFEDGSPAIAVNKFGKGTVVSVIPDAWTVARYAPELMRDVLDYAVKSSDEAAMVDIVGLNENSDVAVSITVRGFSVAIVNYNAEDAAVALKPVGSSTKVECVDLMSGEKVRGEHSLKVSVPRRGFRALDCSR